MRKNNRGTTFEHSYGDLIGTTTTMNRFNGSENLFVSDRREGKLIGLPDLGFWGIEDIIEIRCG